MKAKAISLITFAMLASGVVNAESLTVLNASWVRFGHEATMIALKSESGCVYKALHSVKSPGVSILKIQYKSCGNRELKEEKQVSLAMEVATEVYENSATGEIANYVASGTQIELPE